MAWTDPVNFAEPQIVDETDLNLMQDNLRELWHRVARVEFTADVTTTTATEASPLDVVSSGAITYSAYPTLVRVGMPRLLIPANGGLSLWDASTDMGRLAFNNITMAGVLEAAFTPTAASHTYKARIWTSGGATATASAGAGGVGVLRPGWIEVWVKGGA
jgi:hypothetical protein